MWFLSFIACGVQLPNPSLEAVSPDRGWNGEQTVITISGEAFYPQVEIDTNRAGNVDLDRGYQAWLQADGLGQHQLSAVAVDSYTQLRAVVRSGLGSGQYDLLVEGPTGKTALLEDAFIVSDIRADRLEITAGLVATVNDQVAISIQLLDPLGAPVLADLQVELRAEGQQGALLGTFGSGLEQSEPLTDGFGVRGFLGPDGFALIPLTIRTPDIVVLAVNPVDESTGIRGGQVSQLWEPGNQLVTVIELPSDPLAVVAGDTFPVTVRLRDQFGNDVEGVSEDVLVQSTCGDFIAPWTLTGNDSFDVRPRRSTDFGNCAEQRLVVLQGPQGQSNAFSVQSGPPQSFVVGPFDSVLRAGDEQIALITAHDEFENRTVFPNQLELHDSVGGLGTPHCVPGVNPVDRSCRVPCFKAGDAVTMTATSGAIQGTSDPYTVLPSLEIVRLAILPPAVAVAGEDVSVFVSAFDPYDNPIPAEDVDLAGVELEDETGNRAPCHYFGSDSMGRGEFSCVFTRARADAVLDMDFEGVAVGAPVFEVVNGPVAAVAMDAPGSVVAGESFPIELEAFDAYGNPWRTQTPAGVRVFEPEFGELVPAFSAEGTASVDWVLTVAGQSTVLSLDTGDIEIGATAPILVQAGPATAIEVDLEEPWTFVGTSVQVRLDVFDAFGNPALFDGPADLRDALGAGPDVQVDLLEGTGTGAFVWTTGAIDTSLSAVGPSFTGTTGRIDVVIDCGGAGPAPVADFAGAVSGRACVGGGPAPVAMSLASSVPGAEPIELYVAAVDGQDAVRSSSAAFNVFVEDAGQNAVELLVVDEAGCGGEAEAMIWSGPNDGNPVGALPVQLPVDTAPIGQVLQVDVIGAVDCTGDLSAGEINVRADRGIVTGATPSGTGLVLQLDATGSGSVVLDATAVVTGGDGTAVLASPSGGALAEVAYVLTGDDGSPTVWSQTPSGETTGLVHGVVLEFNEALLPLTVHPNNFRVQGLAPMGIDSAVQTVPGRVELTLATPADADAEAFSVLASSELRDESGNRLDGATTGIASDWTGSFGPLPNSLDPVECAPSTERFRPDGDDGSGDEADHIELAVTSASSPERWRLRVDDGDGDLLWQERLLPVGASDTVRWDGRDDSGRVVADGLYTLRLAAEDAAGNRTAPCVVTVEVDNAGVGP